MVVRKSNDEGVVYINKQYLTEKTGEESNIIATKYCTVVSNTRKNHETNRKKKLQRSSTGQNDPVESSDLPQIWILRENVTQYKRLPVS